MSLTPSPDSRLRRSAEIGAVVVAFLACGGALSASPAIGTFPGENGKIAYGVFESIATGEFSNTYIASVDPARGRGRRVRTCPRKDCGHSQPAFAPGGQRLALEVRGGKIAVGRSDGSRVRIVIDVGRWPAWSPDGRRLIFARDVPGSTRPGTYDLLVTRSDGRGERRIPTRGGYKPDWGSRGSIAFVRRNRDFGFDVYTVRPDGSRLRRLTRRGVGDSPSWSPDGRLLAIELNSPSKRFRGGRQIALIDRRGRLRRVLTRRGGHHPAWSPDGRKTAFERLGSVYVMNANGGGLRRLTRNKRPQAVEVTGVAWAAPAPVGGLVVLCAIGLERGDNRPSRSHGRV